MRNKTMMAVSAFAMVGVGMVAGSFIAPAYSDGISKQYSERKINERLEPYIVNTDTAQRGRDAFDASHDTASHMALTQTTVVASARAPLVVTTDESIDVQARRLPNGAPVAVRGDVVRASRKMLIIDRPDGRVQVRLPGMIPAIMQGDDVTVYGRLSNRSDTTVVRAEAVLQHISADATTLQEKATLHMAPSRLESTNKLNKPVTNGEARRALERYRAIYTEL